MDHADLPGMPAVESDGQEGLREQLRAAIAAALKRFDAPPFGDMACSSSRAAGIAVNAAWPVIAARLAPLDPAQGEGLRRARFELLVMDADLIVVGDKLEEGGRYVERIVPRAESDEWGPVEWMDAYDRLALSWHGRAARGQWS